MRADVSATTNWSKLAKIGKRRRSAYLEEFYREARSPQPEPNSGIEQPHVGVRRRRKGMPIWLLTSILGIVFCLIAVGGSSAMIWLRHLSSIFDVHWTGD